MIDFRLSKHLHSDSSYYNNITLDFYTTVPSVNKHNMIKQYKSF